MLSNLIICFSYGMELNSASSNHGFIKCKISGLGAPFNANASVIIDSPYGRTYSKPTAQHISATGQIFNFQSFAVIDSISPAVGSDAGGQLLTITGKFFDETKSPAEVKVGEETCVVESVSETQVLCRTPVKPSSALTAYPGM